MEDVRIILSVLWLIGEVTLLTFLVLEYMEQGVMEEIIAGNMRGRPLGQGTLLFYAVSLLIPLIMAFLSLTLNYSMIRWANIIMGVIYALLYLGDLIAHLKVPYAYAVLMGIASVVTQLLIVWYTWTWV
jgi:heme A synthase